MISIYFLRNIFSKLALAENALEFKHGDENIPEGIFRV